MPQTVDAWCQFLLAVAMIGILTLVGLYDAWVMLFGDRNSTVSGIVRYWSHQWPVFPLSLGVLIGHLFF